MLQLLPIQTFFSHWVQNVFLHSFSQIRPECPTEIRISGRILNKWRRSTSVCLWKLFLLDAVCEVKLHFSKVSGILVQILFILELLGSFLLVFNLLKTRPHHALWPLKLSCIMQIWTELMEPNVCMKATERHPAAATRIRTSGRTHQPHDLVVQNSAVWILLLTESWTLIFGAVWLPTCSCSLGEPKDTQQIVKAEVLLLVQAASCWQILAATDKQTYLWWLSYLVGVF